MLNKESVVFWTEVEHVLYEENGHAFVIELDLFNNHTYFYHRKDGNYKELGSPFDDIYDAIDEFNKILKEYENEPN